MRLLLGLVGFGLLCAAACNDNFVSDGDEGSDSSVGGTAGGGADLDGNSSAGGTSTGGGAGGDDGEDLPRDHLLLWLRADEGVSREGAGITKWADQSGNGNDAVQVTASAQPTLLANALHGKPVVSFDGVDDELVLPEAFDDFSAGLSIYVAYQLAEIGTCASFVEFSSGGEDNDISLGYWQNQYLYEVQDPFLQTTSGMTIDTPGLLNVVHDLGEVSLRVDGKSEAKGTFPFPATVARKLNLVGGTGYTECGKLHGFIAEIMIYSRALTFQENVLVAAAITKRWL